MKKFLALPIDEQTTSAAWPCPPPVSVFVRDNAGATWHDWLNMLDALEAGLQEMDYKDENWKKTQANLKRARTVRDYYIFSCCSSLHELRESTVVSTVGEYSFLPSRK